MSIVCRPDSTVRESRDRVRAAIRHADLEFPVALITVNLAPADEGRLNGRPNPSQIQVP